MADNREVKYSIEHEEVTKEEFDEMKNSLEISDDRIEGEMEDGFTAEYKASKGNEEYTYRETYASNLKKFDISRVIK